MVVTTKFRESVPHSTLASGARRRLFRKSSAGFLRLNKPVWGIILIACKTTILFAHMEPGCRAWFRRIATREQYFGTFFLRNRPALELMRRLVDKKAKNSTLRATILACSAGAEVYSILWTIRSARPDLNVVVRAVDISQTILNFAKHGVYAPDTSGLVGSSIFERLTAPEMEQMFDWDGDVAKIKPWLREGITWQLGDASSPELIRDLGPQDIVVRQQLPLPHGAAGGGKLLTKHSRPRGLGGMSVCFWR